MVVWGCMDDRPPNGATHRAMTLTTLVMRPASSGAISNFSVMMSVKKARHA